MRLSNVFQRISWTFASFLSGCVLCGFLHAQSGPPLVTAETPFFTATVNHQPLPLHNFDKGSFGIFPLQSPANVQLCEGFDVRWVTVRPLSTEIHATIDANHRCVAFTAKNAIPLTIEFNEQLGRVVHLFPYVPQKNVPQSSTPNVIYFGPGIHHAGQIDLTDNQTLYLAAGAWVDGNVRSIGARNITIEGPGVLDASNIPNGPSGSPSPIYLQETQDAKIHDITIFNSHAWTVHLKHADGTHIDGLKVLNPGYEYGDDGVDIDSSSNVVVENSFIRTNDDCVVVKNLGDVDTHNIAVRHDVLWNMPHGGNGVEIGFETRYKPIHNIHFDDLDMIHIEHGAAISIHNGDAAIVEDVSYNNIRVEDVQHKLIDFAIVYAAYGPDRPKDEKKVRDWMDRGGAWDAILNYPPEDKPELARHRGQIRNIHVNNVRVVQGGLPYSTLVGFGPDHRVENVHIDGLFYQGRRITSIADAKFAMQYTKDITLQ